VIVNFGIFYARPSFQGMSQGGVVSQSHHSRLLSTTLTNKTVLDMCGASSKLPTDPLEISLYLDHLDGLRENLLISYHPSSGEDQERAWIKLHCHVMSNSIVNIGHCWWFTFRHITEKTETGET
jgi:hypothetical protein